MAEELGKHKVEASFELHVTKDRGEGQPTEFHDFAYQSTWHHVPYDGVVALEHATVGEPVKAVLQLGADAVQAGQPNK